jgi:glycine dehydrogenase
MTTVGEFDFAARHVGPAAAERRAMLRALGVETLDELIDQTVPASIRSAAPLDLGPALSETEALEALRRFAARNKVMTSLIGQGYHGTILPPVIQRNVLENPAWYTAYTPYQPEISQGRLEALINFQTLVADLTGLDIANASLLDEATAAAEAMAMAKRIAKTDSSVFFVDRDCHPQTIAVVETRARALGWRIVVGEPARDLDAASVFGALFQYPGSSGEIADPRRWIEALHAAGSLAVMAADPLALTLLTPPGELGADIAVGSMQRFGMPMGLGGPHAAYLATRDSHKRTMPGRLVGVSKDAQGAPAYRLALQTREQHIRREKATSNICTAQALPAIVASMYAVYHGPEGLARIASRIHYLTAVLAAGLRRAGARVVTTGFFDTITVAAGGAADAVLSRAEAEGINLRHNGDTAGRIGISLDETLTERVVEAVWRAFGADLVFADVAEGVADALPPALLRRSRFLGHPTFHRYRSETELLRYMRRLADRDLALDRSMIPLGSCTMKLNATAEMMPVTWPEFAQIHPYAPAAQVEGYRRLFEDLEAKLRAITGYDAISLQPNSGAQGEYAGLLAIRAYHRARGEGGRTVCLIPASAHGTNPASAQLAGMSVVVVATDAQGNVDLADLQAKAAAHAEALAAIMLTYPSTHGVFEEQVREICRIVHDHGGQVYLDGANLNAQVGLARPGDYGADVGHLNLHKTFCIPHGGGGPGMGPIGVKAHLAPYLPGDPLGSCPPCAAGPVSAAKYGSGAILPIAWTYIAMMGGDGLTLATEVAILNANYIATRLAPHYSVLYRGGAGRVAHECILDIRPIQAASGITAEDIAKRLIDYGFHAPTMSFPVPGTLMVEPTESEAKAELDRFCEAMIAIRREIRSVEEGRWEAAQSPLRHAPHTVVALTAEAWDRPYSRHEAAYPGETSITDKYWPPVGRVDNAYGDRNLVCSCPPVEDWLEVAE